ncbi:MAG: phosphatase PAP2 family protein [Desulfosarcinaceae bacterium]|nr:phosphatase PAP2 family protein [Desulfosarcinaceae bacterium]
MDRTLFEGEWMGGGDPVVLVLIIAAVGYYLTWKGVFRPALDRWRPHLGFALTSALITAIQVVHSLKWVMGRARPKEVLERGLAFSHWFEFGPHYVTDGIYRGSFPSGHTAQVFLLMALAYVLAADPLRSHSVRRLGWIWGAFALLYTLIMGVGRCMSFSHWLSDVIGALFLSWVGMHFIYFHLLRVPEQVRFYRRWGQHPQTPLVWEMQLCAWCLGLFIGAMGTLLGMRALLRDEGRLALGFLLLGLTLTWVGLRRSSLLLGRVRHSYNTPPPQPASSDPAPASETAPEGSV